MITLHRCPISRHKKVGLHHRYPYLRFQVCPHRNRYFFKHNSSLKSYLTNHCHGFVPSPDGLYNINYLVIIILKNCEELNLIGPGGFIISTTSYLKKAFKTTEPCLKITEIRRRVISQLEAEAEKLYATHHLPYYCNPLWCVNPKDYGLTTKIRPFRYSQDCSE